MRRLSRWGYAPNLSSRLKSLQTGNPRPIEVVRTYRLLNAERVEKVVHRTLIVQRVTGEWFRWKPCIMDTIQRIVNECGVFVPMPNQYERLSVAV